MSCMLFDMKTYTVNIVCSFMSGYLLDMPSIHSLLAFQLNFMTQVNRKRQADNVIKGLDLTAVY